MSQAGQASFGHEIGRRLLRATIAIGGLLLIKFVVIRLPMVDHASAIEVTPLLGADVAYIAPVALAKTIFDTLLFVVLIFAAIDVGALIRTSVRRIPQLGAMMLLIIIVVVVALAYSSYSDTVLPILGDIGVYNWIFLALGVVPLIGLINLAYRNLDAITDVVFHSGSHAIEVVQKQRHSGYPPCAQCGEALRDGAKFCAKCGNKVPEMVAEPVPDIFCTACGEKNSAGTESCSKCGKPLVKPQA